MFCLKCGIQLPEEAVFCYGCGFHVGGIAQSIGQAAPSPQPTPPAGVPVQPVPAAPAPPVAGNTWTCPNCGTELSNESVYCGNCNDVRLTGPEDGQVSQAGKALIKCSRCNRDVSRRAEACPACGTPVIAPTYAPQPHTPQYQPKPGMVQCQGCGKEINEKAGACPSCATRTEYSKKILKFYRDGYDGFLTGTRDGNTLTWNFDNGTKMVYTLVDGSDVPGDDGERTPTPTLSPTPASFTLPTELTALFGKTYGELFGAEPRTGEYGMGRRRKGIPVIRRAVCLLL